MWVWVWDLGSAQAQPQDEATQAQVLQAAPAQEESQSPILLPSMMTGRHVVGPALIPSRTAVTAERVPQTQAELHNPCLTRLTHHDFWNWNTSTCNSVQTI